MLNELDILKKLLPTLPAGPGVLNGPGDDCAVLEWSAEHSLLAAVDQVAGDVHYLYAETAPEAAGRKLMCRNLSDIAAMGGIPRWALLAVASGHDDPDWVVRFCQGAAAAGRAYEVAVVGGDIAALPGRQEAAALTILGEIPQGKAVLRSGAEPGDLVYVTGCLGNSFASGHHLDFQPRLREGQLLSRGGWASAMLDVSDGLALDAARLAQASGVRLRLDPARLPLREGATPQQALSDGEDYELLFTVPAARATALKREWDHARESDPDFAALSRIGEVEALQPEEDGRGNRAGEVVDMRGKSLLNMGKTGYEH